MPMELATAGVITALSGLLSSLPSLFGDSDQEEAVKGILNKLSQNSDWVSAPSFSKDELFNNIYPQLKSMFKGAANVSAGQIGAKLGEISPGMGGGQNTGELYMQSLAPIIAQGEINSAQSLQGLVQLFSLMDDAAKKRFLSLSGLQLEGAQGLDTMNPYEKMFINFLQGANMGATALGNINMATTNLDKKFLDLLKNSKFEEFDNLLKKGGGGEGGDFQ